MVRPLARRLVAAAFAAGAVGFGLLAVRPEPATGAAPHPGPVRSSSGLLDGRPGQVAVPVRIADAGAVRLLRPGDRIDVLAVTASDTAEFAAAAGPPRTVGAGLTVLAVPKTGDAEQGALVVLAADRVQATVLAGAGPRLALTILPR